MTDLQKQKRVVQYLIDQADKYGRGYFPLAPIAAELGMTVTDLFDKNTESGLIHSLTQYGTEGMVNVLPGDWENACVFEENERWAENWAQYEP